jgi:hypothetical protein
LKWWNEIVFIPGKGTSMDQLVQLAVTTANKGDKNKAMEYLKQAIASNVRDVDAWLVLSALVDQEDRKRQCLNRVLALDPVNRIAREELLKLDRAAMGGTSIPQTSILPEDKQTQVSVSQPVAASATSQLLDSSNIQSDQSFATPPSNIKQPQTLSRPVASQKSIEKPRIFRYPILILVAAYSFGLFFACASILALQDTTAFLVSCSLFLATLVSVWIVSAKVEVSEKGIIASRMFGLSRGQMGWGEIEQVRSIAGGQTLELIARKDSSLKVTSQVSGYPEIVQILREKRPDLFGMAPSLSPEGQTQFGGNDVKASNLAPAFTEKKVFIKSFWRQFGSYLITVPLFLVSVWTVFTDEKYMIGALLLGGACLFMMISPFFDVSTVKVEGNKITIGTFFEEKVVTARQIKEIKMKSIRSRSRVSHFTIITTEQGKKYSLGGFSEGSEIIYGFLFNWWNSCRNQ